MINFPLAISEGNNRDTDTDAVSVNTNPTVSAYGEPASAFGSQGADYVLNGTYARSVSPSAESDIASSSLSSPRECIEHEFTDKHKFQEARFQKSSRPMGDGQEALVPTFESIHKSAPRMEQERAGLASTFSSMPMLPSPTMASASATSPSLFTGPPDAFLPSNTSDATPSTSIVAPANSHSIQPPQTGYSPSSLALPSPSSHPRRPSPERPAQTSITSAELDLAKNLVLDILGWGVPPEVLLASGLSPHAVLRIFTDLNLRLPANLVVSDEVWERAGKWAPLPPDPRVETLGR